jgi:hypothetical protein
VAYSLQKLPANVAKQMIIYEIVYLAGIDAGSRRGKWKRSITGDKQVLFTKTGY